MLRNTFIALGLGGITACTPTQPEGERQPAQASGPPEIPTVIRGDCSSARPIGPTENYVNVLRIRSGGRPSARVRTGPVWQRADLSDVIGEIPDGTLVAAFGPIKGQPSMGVGWIVPLRDDRGATCRGYVSNTVVEEVERAQLPEPMEPFPDALGASGD